jgi:hypothetical protein
MLLSWAFFQTFLHMFAKTAVKIFDQMSPQMDHLPHFLSLARGTSPMNSVRSGEDPVGIPPVSSEKTPGMI